MITYTYKIICDYERYRLVADSSNDYTFLNRTYFFNDNKEEQTNYLVYELERDGEPIGFLEDSDGGIVWREEEKEQ